MNNQKILYIVVAALVLVNVATFSYFIGVNKSKNYVGYKMMGRGSHMYDEDHWEEMQEFMEEFHKENIETNMHKEIDYNKPVAETHNKTYDFGKIKKSDGIVSTEFEIENHGKQTLEIGEISTSCGCTTAEMSVSELGFNEEAKLTVYFDPNYHDEPQGKITRSVFVKTNDEELPEMQFDVYVEIME